MSLTWLVGIVLMWVLCQRVHFVHSGSCKWSTTFSAIKSLEFVKFGCTIEFKIYMLVKNKSDWTPGQPILFMMYIQDITWQLCFSLFHPEDRNKRWHHTHLIFDLRRTTWTVRNNKRCCRQIRARGNSRVLPCAHYLTNCIHFWSDCLAIPPL